MNVFKSKFTSLLFLRLRRLRIFRAKRERSRKSFQKINVLKVFKYFYLFISKLKSIVGHIFNAHNISFLLCSKHIFLSMNVSAGICSPLCDAIAKKKNPRAKHLTCMHFALNCVFFSFPQPNFPNNENITFIAILCVILCLIMV